GNAAANTITIAPTSGNIDGGANVVINTAYGWWYGVYDGAKWKTVSRSPLALASAQSQPANPTGTTDTTGKMMGLAGSITPTASWLDLTLAAITGGTATIENLSVSAHEI